MDNLFEIQTKRVRSAINNAIQLSSDKEEAKNAWTNVLTLLTDLKSSVDQKRNELNAIKEKLQIVEATPTQITQNIGNTNYENGQLKTEQQKVEPNKASLSYDLDILIDRLYKGKLKHNEGKYEESINKRADHLAKAFASGKFLSSLKNMPKLTDKKSYGEILSEFSQQSTLINNLKQKEAETEANSELYRTLKQIRKKQKEKQERSFVGAVVKFVGGMIIGNITHRINEVVKDVKIVVKTKMATSRIGRNIINRTTKASADLHEITSTFKKGINTTTKILKGGYDVLATGGKIAKSLGRSILPAGAVLALSGSGPLAITYLAGSTALKTITYILDDPNLSSLRGLRELQINQGRGIFYKSNGALKVDSLIPGTKTPLFDKALVGQDAELLKDRVIDMAQTGRIDKSFGRVLRLTDAVSTWAPVGALVASLLGVSPVLGGILTGAGALGIQAIANEFKGGKLPFKALQGMSTNPAFRFIAELPFSEFLDKYQTNMWFGEQIDLIKNRYRGDFGAYFRDNWNPFVNGNIFKTALVVSNIFNMGGAAFSVANPAVASWMLKNAGKLIPEAAKVVGGGGMSSAALAGASMIGSLAGIATAILLGIPIGPAMILGSVIGATAGLAVGTILSLTVTGFTGGVGFVLTAGISYVTTLIGSWIGSLFDKALGLSGALTLNFLQSLMALFQIISLITQRFDFSNIMPIALGLITLMATLYKAGILDTSNECLGDSCSDSTSSSTGVINNNIQIIELSSFDIKLLIPSNSTINSDTLSNITAYLNDQDTNLSEKFFGKKIVLNLTSNESFADEQMVILGIGNENLYSEASISTAIDNSIKNYQGTTSVNNDLLGNEYTFLNISN